MLAANAPDVDVLAYFGGEYAALAFRRGITHGLPAQLLLPLAVAGTILAWDRMLRRRFRPDAPAARPGPVLLLALVGVLTHPAMDWLNVYGMRWWMPLSGAWSYGDTLFIIDPWLWLLLGSAVVLSGAGGGALWAVLGLLTSVLMVLGPVPALASAVWVASILALAVIRWRRRRRSPAPSDGVARGLVGAAAAYLALMLVAGHAGERRVAAAARAAGLEVEEVMLSPRPADPFGAEVEVRTPTGYVPGEHRWLPRPRVLLRPEARVPHLRAPDGASATEVEGALEAARRTPEVRDWLVWSRYPYAVVERAGEGWRVRWADARYDGRGGAGGLSGVTVTVR